MQWLSKLLSVKDEERPLVLYYVALFLLIGVGLALGRGSMAALFLKRYGVEYLPVMYAILSVCMAAASLTYAAYVDRVPSERLFIRMLAVLGAFISFLWGMMFFTSAEWVYPAYYLVFEIASELLIIHIKLYAEQNFDGLQLQRLASPLFASTSIGKVVGGLLLGVSVTVIGVVNTLLIWAALLAIPAVLVLRYHRRAGISPFFRSGRKGRDGLKHSMEQIAQGFRFLRKTELLRASSFAFFFMVVSFFILNYSIDRVLTETFPDERRLASFIGLISAVTGAIALLTQLFVTGKLLRRYGATTVGLALPTFMTASFVGLLATFTLPAALLAIFTRDVIVHAIRKPARMALLHALPPYMMGRINALSVGLVLPVALIATSGLLLLTQKLPVTTYFIVGGVFASLAYLYFRVRANRAYAPTLLQTLSHRLFLPNRHGEQLEHAGNDELRKELERGIAGPDENMAYAYARMFVAIWPEQAPRVIAARLPGASHRTRDRLLRLLIKGKLPAADILHDALADTDTRLRATILEALIDLKDTRAIAHVAPCLESDNARIAALGVLGVHRYGLRDLDDAAHQAWERLLSGDQDGQNIAGLELFGRIHRQRLLPRLSALLAHRSERVRRAALNALAQFSPGTLAYFRDALEPCMRADEPEVRIACLAALRVLDPPSRRELCMQALDDDHHAVRDAALAHLEEGEGRAQAAEVVKQWVFENRGTPRAQQSALAALARYRVPGEVFERIAEMKVKEAGALFRGLEILRREPNDDAVDLLKVILQERVSQMLDVVLMAMENFEDRAAIEAVRAGLASHDRPHIAHACEALHNLHNHALCGPLIAIIDPPGTGAAKHGHGHGHDDGVELQTAGEVLAWCLKHPDAWLRECAARVTSLPLAAGA